MINGNLYLVTYKQYKNDTAPLTVKVFATDKSECERKVNESGLIKHTGFYDNNDGYIISIVELESGVL